MLHKISGFGVLPLAYSSIKYVKTLSQYSLIKSTLLISIPRCLATAFAAYLLKEQGYEVIGVFMRNWDSQLNNDILGNPTNDNDICPQEQDYIDAKAVAKHLGIEIRRVDFIKEYWDNSQ